MGHLWDPLGLHVLETGGAGDGETDEDNILKEISVRPARYNTISLQYENMQVVSDCPGLGHDQPCHRERD